MQVNVYAAGDHSHAENGDVLPNGSTSDASDLIQYFLEKAGYSDKYAWQCRIEKMTHGSPENRPVRVVGYKAYGVSLKIKPKENSTVDQLVTLFMPDGSNYTTRNVFEQLRANEKKINRQWRKEIKRDKKTKELNSLVVNIGSSEIPETPIETPSQIQVQLVPTPQIPETPKVEKTEKPVPEVAFKNLRGIVDNKKKLKYALEKVDAVNKVIDPNHSFKDFVDGVAVECGWETSLPRIISRVLRQISSKGYLISRLKEGREVGFDLTKAAYELIGHGQAKPKAPAKQKKTRTSKPPLKSLLINSRNKIQELADVTAKLQANQSKRQQLQSDIERIQGELAVLEQEDIQISKVVAISAYGTLEKLLEEITILPMAGHQG